MVASKIGFLFPGQGAQYVGMGKEAADQSEKVRSIYREADQILGFPLSQICFQGPEEMLTRTLYAQPAIFVTSLALLSLLEEKFPELKPELVAGLSLGEFSALAAAQSFSFSDGLILVKVRAEAMEKAASEKKGAMISILGLSQEECQSVAKEAGCEMANCNAPDQFVLSGNETAIDRAAGIAEAKGAQRAIRLKVSGAFHSSLMESARQRFEEAVGKITIRVPRYHFVPNVTAEEEGNPDKIRTLLAKQLTHPVQWIQTIYHARDKGIQRFIEIGPGRVLKGLIKRIDPSLAVLTLEKPSDLQALESELGKGLPCC